MIIDGNRAADRAIELVLGYYAAFNRGDWEGMLSRVAPDVAHDINQGPREAGKVTFAAFLARMNRCYREQLRDVVVMANQEGTRVAAEYVVHGEYLADDTGLPAAHGQKYVLPGGAFFDVRDGQLTRITNYYNLEDWIAQVSG
jgi:steroid delta-isomerase-like uncharacterized protein